MCVREKETESVGVCVRSFCRAAERGGEKKEQMSDGERDKKDGRKKRRE